MMFINPSNRLTDYVVKKGLIKDGPLTFLDAGCSGGICHFLRLYEPFLSGLGIDPVVGEIRRLKASEKNQGISYCEAFLKGSSPSRDDAYTTMNPWSRFSSAAAMDKIRLINPPKKSLSLLNLWNAEKLSRVHLTLDQACLQSDLRGADFIKIDVDGPDYEILQSGEGFIRQAPTLGILLEVNFYGGAGTGENTFHNIDRLMRAWGYDLFGLFPRKYSMSALPNAFEWDCPAQSVTGRPYQGDAFYALDWVASAQVRERLSPLQILKLACLFENFSLPDVSAELLIHAGKLLPNIDLGHCLDLLTFSFRQGRANYRSHLAQFEKDPASFYRSRHQEHW
jgi:hypothetical protein